MERCTTLPSTTGAPGPPSCGRTHPSGVSDRIFSRKDWLCLASALTEQRWHKPSDYERAKRASRARGILQCRCLVVYHPKDTTTPVVVRPTAGEHVARKLKYYFHPCNGVAKKPRRRRRMGKYLRGSVDDEVGFAALAAKDVAEAAFDEVVNERTLVSSVVASYTLSNFTPIASAGPIVVGLSHSDYSSAEIEEWIETTGSWNETDLVQQEVASRKIRRIGVFETPDAATDSVALNDGRPMKTKLNWILNQGQTLNLWVYNSGAAAVATTTPVVHANGHANLWPR